MKNKVAKLPSTRLEQVLVAERKDGMEPIHSDLIAKQGEAAHEKRRETR